MVQYSVPPSGAAGVGLSGTYPNPSVAQSSAGTFTVENTLTVDGTSNLSGSNLYGTMIQQSGGKNSAPSAAVLATPPFANGTAAQLSDVARDYMIYLTITTGGTATTLAIGPTSTPASTILSSSPVVAGQHISFRLPAGWYVKWAGTLTAIATQVTIGC
jgi:hypothetical protein